MEIIVVKFPGNIWRNNGNTWPLYGLTWDKNGIFKRDIGYGWGYDGDVMEISWWYSEIQPKAINYVCLTPMMTVANWPLMVTYIRLSLRNIHFNGHSRNLNWRYLPYIRPIFLGLCTHKTLSYMVLTYLHLLDPGDLPLNILIRWFFIFTNHKRMPLRDHPLELL